MPAVRAACPFRAVLPVLPAVLVTALAVAARPLRAQSGAGGQTDAQSLFSQARGAFAQDQLDRAYRLAEQAAAAAPQRADIQLLLGDVACARSEGRLTSAMGRRCGAAYRRAVELAPDSATYQEALAGWLELAPRSAGGGRDSALALAARLSGKDEVRGTALEAAILWRWGGVHRRRGDSLMSALGVAHAAERPVVFRVGDYWTLTRRPDSALAAYSTLVEHDPHDVIAQYFLGRQMVIMKRDPRGAMEHLLVALMAIAPPPENGGGATYTRGAPWWRMGQAFEQLGKTDSARFCFEQALALNPGMPEAQASLDSLKRRH